MNAARLVLKTLALCLGFIGALVSIMSVVGLLTDGFFVRLGVAGAVLVLAPLLVANQFIPKDEAEGLGAGVISDTYAVVWLAVATLVVGALLPFTRDVLADEVRRLRADDHRVLAGLTELMIGAVDAPPLAAAALPATPSAPAP